MGGARRPCAAPGPAVIRAAALATSAVLAATGIALLHQPSRQARPRSGAFDTDLTLLQNQLPQIHPNVDVQALDAAVAQFREKLPTLTEDQADVGFMELVASLGDRNGHTGIFPLDPGNQPGVPRVPLSRLRVRRRRLRHRPARRPFPRRRAPDRRRRHPDRAGARAGETARAARQRDDRRRATSARCTCSTRRC